MNCKNKMASRIFGIALSVMMVFTGMFSPFMGNMDAHAAATDPKTIEIKGNPSDTAIGETLTAIVKDQNGNVVENAVFKWSYGYQENSGYDEEYDDPWEQYDYREVSPSVTGNKFTVPEQLGEKSSIGNFIKVQAGTASNNMTTNTKMYLKIVDRDPVDYDNQGGGVSDSDILDAIESAFRSTYTPKFGTDSNIVTYMQGIVDNMDDSEGVTVSLKNATEDGYIAADGTITYYYKDIDENKSTLTWGTNHYARVDVPLTLTKGTATKDVTRRINLYWDLTKLKADLQKYVLDCLSADDIKGSNDSLNAVTENLSMPAKLDGKTYGVIGWTSSDSSVIAISGDEDHGYTGIVTRADTDKEVTITAYIADYMGMEDDDQVSALTSVKKDFTVTVKADENGGPLAIMQKVLNEAVTEESVCAYSGNDKLDSFSEIDCDFTLPRVGILSSAVTKYGYEGKKYIGYESSNQELLYIDPTNGSGVAKVTRPLPGKDNTVVLTAIMSDCLYKNIKSTPSAKVVKKTFTLTIKPIDGDELAAEIAKDAALIEKVKADFWNAIKGENTDKDAVNQNLHRFYEANLASNGTDVEYIYQQTNMKDTGIIISDQSAVVGVSDDDGIYIKSSKPQIISDNLLVFQGQPEYDTKVTLTAYLTSARFEKYAKAHPEDATYQAIYKQPVRLTITVPGAKGEKPNTGGGSTPATMSVKVKVDGKGFSKFVNIENYTYTASTSEDHTAWDALKAAFDANGYKYGGGGSYVSSVTDAQNHVLAHLVHGENSGWMYNLNGKLSDLVLNNQYIDDGDEIYFFYTGDYKEEPQVKEKGHGGSGAAVADQPKPTAEDPTAQAAIAKTEEKTDAAGNKATIATDVNGKTATKVEVSAEAVKKAAEAGTAVALPVPQIKPQADVKKADSVKVELPSGTAKAAVTVPVTGADVNTVLMKVAEDGTLTPVPTAVVTEDGAAVAATVDSGNYVVVENKVEFADVKAGDWFAEGAGFAGSRNLMVGVGGGKFDQAGKLTTAQTAAVIGRLKGEGTSESWNKAVAQFGNAQVNSRENTIGMLCAAYKELGGKVEVNPETGATAGYADADKISAENREAFLWAVQMGIIKGVGENRLDPAGDLTRGQFGTMLERFVKLLAKSAQTAK